MLLLPNEVWPFGMFPLPTRKRLDKGRQMQALVCRDRQGRRMMAYLPQALVFWWLVDSHLRQGKGYKRKEV